MISRAAIETAAHQIEGDVRHTPVLRLESRAWGIPAQITLKLEHLQHTGSFKPRGAFSRMRAQPLPEAGVIAASGGNHGVAVAYAAQQLGCRAEIFVPELCPPLKVQRLRHYGAQVQVVGATYAEALAASEIRAEETGALMVHAYDQPEVVAGQGTLGRELAQQVPDLEMILVAVGGGGLIGGIAAWFGRTVRVIGVEPEHAPTLHTALQVGRPVEVEVGGIAVDALGARRVGTLAFALATQSVETVLLVSDEAIREAQRRLWDDLRLVVEPAGATALAALLSGAYHPRANERIGVVLCGANADLTPLVS
jgi:threonine dehydratase